MLPVVAIVGRPNVGKSTLFNALTGTRDAIVADVPGVTRDRQYGYGRAGGRSYVVIDTGGLIENPVGIEAQMRIQTERAVEEADRLVLLADARAGLTAQDLFVARELHRAGKPVFLAINKAEGHGGLFSIARKLRELKIGEKDLAASQPVALLPRAMQHDDWRPGLSLAASEESEPEPDVPTN